jgi:uncharacterized oligopeptide transporter (OPT) family protein
MRLRLPKLGTPAYYVLLALVASLILGPLGGVTAAYMNFKLGFFLGGQVLAGILGSVVTLGYGPDGKHGANYMQTMAASVASMAAMGVLVQAMVWLGMPLPPAWQLILYFLCIGMFGVGVGMLYTPILVDKLKLTYPSGLAVANILRALTDKALLKRSVSTLAGGFVGGVGLSVIINNILLKWPWLVAWADTGNRVALAVTNFSAANFGGGMIVGARISASAILVGFLGVLITPWLQTHGYSPVGEILHHFNFAAAWMDAAHFPWLDIHGYIGPDDPFRKIGFIFALGTILGAASVDMFLLAFDAVKKVRAARTATPEHDTGPPAHVGRLITWVVLWGTALVIVAWQVIGISPIWIIFAIVMSFVFQMVNGISQGITDQNPISSAFVVTVLIMAGIGLRQPIVGLFAGSVLLVSCSVGVDMQQDRSTGWRLGSSRAIQFRFQMLGVLMGAVLAVLMVKIFLEAFPVLKINLHEHAGVPGAKAWSSAMTYKFVGILRELGQDKTRILHVLFLGLSVGLTVEILRKRIFRSAAYKAWKVRSRGNAIIDFILDALLLASPYASSFGGFVEFESALWFGMGGVLTSVLGWFALRRRRARVLPKEGHVPEGEIPEDMSGTSLVGGGFIAGEGMYFIYVGIASLVSSGALSKIFGN